MTDKHEHSGRSSEHLLDKEIILKGLNLTVGQTVVDAGCGNGYMAREFSKKVGSTGQVYALDVHQPSIDQLSRDLTASNIIARCADMSQKTEIEDNSVDVIYLSMVFHGFSPEQQKGFLAEARRILKPDGIMAIVEIDKKPAPFGPHADIKFSPEELCQAVNMNSHKCTIINQYIYMQTFINNKSTI
ncbi:MAG: class I SAM-dependent methyltransferase [Sedimentisphaerales bacterium]|nr:class I SAM-dependent methyltransferase [Sedimentisphaerales bacterium]MBN2842173.1 class I SAM-dependent methyltransferase [Sedimentisphaerales bacterium]